MSTKYTLESQEDMNHALIVDKGFTKQMEPGQRKQHTIDNIQFTVDMTVNGKRIRTQAVSRLYGGLNYVQGTRIAPQTIKFKQALFQQGSLVTRKHPKAQGGYGSREWHNADRSLRISWESPDAADGARIAGYDVNVVRTDLGQSGTSWNTPPFYYANGAHLFADGLEATPPPIGQTLYFGRQAIKLPTGIFGSDANIKEGILSAARYVENMQGEDENGDPKTFAILKTCMVVSKYNMTTNAATFQYILYYTPPPTQEKPNPAPRVIKWNLTVATGKLGMGSAYFNRVADRFALPYAPASEDDVGNKLYMQYLRPAEPSDPNTVGNLSGAPVTVAWKDETYDFFTITLLKVGYVGNTLKSVSYHSHLNTTLMVDTGGGAYVAYDIHEHGHEVTNFNDNFHWDANSTNPEFQFPHPYYQIHYNYVSWAWTEGENPDKVYVVKYQNRLKSKIVVDATTIAEGEFEASSTQWVQPTGLSPDQSINHAAGDYKSTGAPALPAVAGDLDGLLLIYYDYLSAAGSASIPKTLVTQPAELFSMSVSGQFSAKKLRVFDALVDKATFTREQSAPSTYNIYFWSGYAASGSRIPFTLTGTIPTTAYPLKWASGCGKSNEVSMYVLSNNSLVYQVRRLPPVPPSEDPTYEYTFTNLPITTIYSGLLYV